MPRSSHRPVKISKDADLKAVVDYFDNPRPPSGSAERAARAKAEREKREREAAMEAQIRAKEEVSNRG